MIAFVNKIAQAVEKEFPKAIIETLAYQYTRKPPKTIRPRANVMPCLCTIRVRLLVSHPAQRVQREPGVHGRHPRLERDLQTPLRSGLHHQLSRLHQPFPERSALQGNVQFFHTNRVDYLFEQGAYQGRHGDFAELKAWLLAKWLWNPDLPAEPLLEDFFKGYYGAAAPYVRTYFDALHSYYRDPGETIRASSRTLATRCSRTISTPGP